MLIVRRQTVTGGDSLYVIRFYRRVSVHRSREHPHVEQGLAGDSTRSKASHQALADTITT